MTHLEQVQNFMQTRRLVLVGVSRREKHFSRLLFREFLKDGYQALPVNRDAVEVDNCPAFKDVQSIDPVPETALLMTKPEQTARALTDCLNAGIQRIWIYNPKAFKRLPADLLQQCREKGAMVFSGACPYMFFADAGTGHRIHGWLWKLFSGGRPAAQA